MASFLNQYNMTLDDKGRAKLPSAFKRCLDEMKEDTLVLTNLGECIMALPYKEWQIVYEKPGEKPTFNRDKRAAQRFLFSSSHTVKVDKQGRLLVPNSLRIKTSLSGEVVLVGVNNSFEIWSRAQWENYERACEERRPEILGSLP